MQVCSRADRRRRGRRAGMLILKSDVHAEFRPCLCQSSRDFLVEFSEALREFSEFSEFSRNHREQH